MAHAAHHDPVATRKTYIQVFKWLCILTVIEVAVVFLKKIHVPDIIVNLMVVFFSCMKAVLVGYYYMHLKQETKWLKIMACLPVIAFCYAFVLGLDLKVYPRPIEDYAGAPERVFKGQPKIADLPAGAALEQVVNEIQAPAASPGTENAPAAEAKESH